MINSNTVTAYQTTFKAVYNWFLNDFTKIPGVQAGYNYAGAFEEIIKADLAQQQAKLTEVMTVRLADALNIWTTNKAMCKSYVQGMRLWILTG